MRRRRAVFMGAVRNCASYLPGVLDNIERLSSLYAEARFIFLVSDSVDDSYGILRAWLSDKRYGKVVELGTLSDKFPKRTERLAHVRNRGLDLVRQCGGSGYDHLVVLDVDDVLAQPVCAEAFLKASQWLDEVETRAAVLANAVPRYYDIWALRHGRWCPQDCWRAIWDRPLDRRFDIAKFHEVILRQIKIPRGVPPIEVRSAFGGLGIYRISYALAARYQGLDAESREVSEHVAFNEKITNLGGRLFIFPALVVHAPQQHLYQRAEFGWRCRVALQLQRLKELWTPPWRCLLAPDGNAEE